MKHTRVVALLFASATLTAAISAHAQGWMYQSGSGGTPPFAYGDPYGHADAAIRIFDPDFDVGGIKPKQPTPLYNVSFRGEFVRIILDMMREAQGPVTTRKSPCMSCAGGV
jgi:hypothetical protein